ncbi:unnamed protein product [Miscanthus lutarioriparius]|uniref:Band 7 domain-containing protein n=1 Tax=Miscanthus lutarioriparius TaxID=422564 RepID=A0A811MUX8_9POAL|nr:unnamed protein product [Miscanthus lutarioriparius]
MGKLVAAIGRFLCFVQVDQSKVCIKERFGKFEDVLDPGCHFVPWIIGKHVKVIRATVPKLELDDTCKQKNEIAKAVEEELEKAMFTYGYEIVQTLVNLHCGNVPGTSAKDVMDLVLTIEFFDTMKEIGAAKKSSAVFLPHGPGAVADIASQIRDGFLQASTQQTK